MDGDEDGAPGSKRDKKKNRRRDDNDDDDDDDDGGFGAGIHEVSLICLLPSEALL